MDARVKPGHDALCELASEADQTVYIAAPVGYFVLPCFD
jgi:hypothetical protein